MKPIRTAVFGLGRMGWGAHFERLTGDDRYDVVAVADQVEKNRERAVEACGCRAFADAGEVIAKAKELDLELAVNVLPSYLHVDVGIACLEAGLHTVIEKPLAPDVAGVEALIDAAHKAGKHLLAHHNRRFNKLYCALKQAVESGALGRLFHLSLNMNGTFARRNDWQTLRDRDGGLLRNHGTHWIDLALYVLDEAVTDVWGDNKLICAAGDAEDHTKILFRTDSGCVVDITCSTACEVNGKVPTIIAYGTAGTLVSDSNDQFTVQRFDPAAQHAVHVELGPREKWSGDKIELTEETIDVRETDTGGDYYDNVVEVIRHDAEPRVPLTQVLDVHRVIDRAAAPGVADWRPPNYKPATSMIRPDAFELNDGWIGVIRGLAPKEPTVPPKQARKALMFSECKGFQHWVTPHTAALVRVLGESGAFEVVETSDVMDFMPDKLEQYDAVIFNNTCPTRERRDQFSDYVDDASVSEALKDSVIDFVAKGGGFVPLHGGNLAYMFCEKWEAMQGMTFCHHPYQQDVKLTPIEPDHPLLRAFDGKPFVHFDEPYFFVCKYTEPDFRPLLEMDLSTMRWVEQKGRHSGPCYGAWIKRYGNGRVFYTSPSHNAQSFEDKRLLQFMLDGIQYALGDLECDDSPSPDARASVVLAPVESGQ